ncbi:hypothetical protein PHJA_002432300 [Phtheirospermum japonicum]|uniref:Uncharacterized protein n=1 Tax=Phtheirospermum japonicum TaxID=374723 RepID=A0A830D353_9LAMI|nr:hypothetical protein PHJA_002432300 [Phtheirospermum japonicum]
MTRFRSQMLLVLSGGLTSFEPKCSLCCQHEYTPNLNYMACEVCRVWFHADESGVGDDEIGNIFRLKCHGCLDKRTPIYPHRCQSSNKKQRAGSGRVGEEMTRHLDSVDESEG